MFFVDFFIDFGEDEISCKQVLDLLSLLFTIQPFNLPTMNDKYRKLNIYTKTDDEIDNTDFAKSQLENALYSELRKKVGGRKQDLNKTLSGFFLDLKKENIMRWELEEIIKENFDSLFLELFRELVSTL